MTVPHIYGTEYSSITLNVVREACTPATLACTSAMFNVIELMTDLTVSGWLSW